MKTGRRFVPSVRERVSAVWEASRLVVRALMHHRMGSVLPLLLVLLLLSYAGMAVAILSPVAFLPRGAQIVPFIYPLF